MPGTVLGTQGTSVLKIITFLKPTFQLGEETIMVNIINKKIIWYVTSLLGMP